MNQSQEAYAAENGMYFEIQPQFIPVASVVTALQRASGNSEV